MVVIRILFDFFISLRRNGIHLRPENQATSTESAGEHSELERQRQHEYRVIQGKVSSHHQYDLRRVERAHRQVLDMVHHLRALPHRHRHGHDDAGLHEHRPGHCRVHFDRAALAGIGRAVRSQKRHLLIIQKLFSTFQKNFLFTFFYGIFFKSIL